MLDLEERLRTEARQQADDFIPSPDLPQRVATGIRRRQQRRVALASAAAVLVVGLTAAGVAALSGDGGDNVKVEPPAHNGTTAPATAAAAPAVGPETPLSRSGIGPIRAGMTIRQAEAAAGITLSVNEGTWTNNGSSCGVFTTPGMDTWFVARTPGEAPSDDPKTAVIDAIGSATSRTAEGIAAGSTVDDLEATYGEATDAVVIPDPMFDSRLVYLFWEGDFSYGFLVEGGVVTDLRSGHVGGISAFDPCTWSDQG